MRREETILLVVAVIAAVFMNRAEAQCLGHLAEDQPPPAVRWIGLDDEGFVARYWAWDDLNHRRGGNQPPEFVDTDGGLLLTGLDWNDAEVCQEAGAVLRTAVLVEALGADGYGRWALVNLAGDAAGNVDVDEAQHALGQVWSLAVPVPSPTLLSVAVGEEAVEVELAWQLDWRGERLSDLVGDLGEPLPSVRGFAIYLINGVEPTSRPWDWSFIDDLEPDAVNGYSTDHHATVSLPREVFSDQRVCFALALTFDGDGDADGERPESRSVHGEYLGAPSPWIHLPPLGDQQPTQIVDLQARLQWPRLSLSWEGRSAPVQASYRLWAWPVAGRPQLLAEPVVGQLSHSLDLRAPAWCALEEWRVVVEMVDAEGRVIASADAVPRR